MENFEKHSFPEKEQDSQEEIKFLSNEMKQIESYLVEEDDAQRLFHFFEQEAFVQYLSLEGESFFSSEDTVEGMEEKLAHIDDLRDFLEKENALLLRKGKGSNIKMISLILKLSEAANSLFEKEETLYLEKIKENDEFEERDLTDEELKKVIEKRSLYERLNGISDTLRALSKILARNSIGENSRYSKETLDLLKERVRQLSEEGKSILEHSNK